MPVAYTRELLANMIYNPGWFHQKLGGRLCWRVNCMQMNSLTICSSCWSDMDWSVDRQCEFMLYWTILIFLARGSAGFVDGSTGLSSSGSGLFWEGMLGRHFSLCANKSFAADASDTGLVISTAKKFQMGSLCFVMMISLVMVWTV